MNKELSNAIARLMTGTNTETYRDDKLTTYRLVLRPRVLRDVSEVDTSAVLFGKKFSFPVGISPSVMQKLVGSEGEIDVAKAVARRGTFMILSSNSTSPLEDVLSATSLAPEAVNFWFQIYVSQDRSKSAKLIRRAEGK